MKLYAIAITAILALSGCAGSTKVANNETVTKRQISSGKIHGCVVKNGPNCEDKIKWDCPSRFEDACNKNPDGKHKCVAIEGPGCRSRIAWQCDEGFENGCNLGTTTKHTCVQSDTALGGSSCTREIMMVCPDGFIDGCNQADEEEEDNRPRPR